MKAPKCCGKFMEGVIISTPLMLAWVLGENEPFIENNWYGFPLFIILYFLILTLQIIIVENKRCKKCGEVKEVEK